MSISRQLVYKNLNISDKELKAKLKGLLEIADKPANYFPKENKQREPSLLEKVAYQLQVKNMRTTPVLSSAVEEMLEIAAERSGGYPYSTVQVLLPDPLSARIKKYANNIPDEKIFLSGNDPYMARIKEPHVTVKYGLETMDPNDVREVVKGTGYIPISFGRVALFENSEFNILVVKVISEQLKKLYRLLTYKLASKSSMYTYNPHVTIAYLRPTYGLEYVGDMDFQYEEFIAHSVQFCGKNEGKKEMISLRK